MTAVILIGAFALFMGIHALLDHVDYRMTLRIWNRKLQRLRDNRHNN